jgi:hypothetical protein
MALKIVCSGYLVRHPLGGHSWHHLQYLVGFRRLGHEVTFYEEYGWPDSCYDPARDRMTATPDYGLAYTREVLGRFGLDGRWCYLAEDGTAHGMAPEQLAQACREGDVYFNLSCMNSIAEAGECRRRVAIDTDPVFTQVGGHGLAGQFSGYHILFTFGENVHRPGCAMPTAGQRWLPTRQPVVLDLWPVGPPNPSAPFTTVMNWSAYGDREHAGRVYGQKDREFEPFFALPRRTGEAMEIAVGSPPPGVADRLAAGGWRLADPLAVTRTPWTYQDYLRDSRAEFCVAKHGYVTTRCGWFSERSCSYLASGRPVVVQDTGFSDFLPCGRGLLAFRTPAEAAEAIRTLRDDYEDHCRAARALAEEYFDARRVLTELLERSL